MRWRALALTLGLAGTPGCTLVAIGATSSAIGVHNAAVDSQDHWSYGTPILVSAVVGLVADVVFVMFLAKQWSKPMT